MQFLSGTSVGDLENCRNGREDLTSLQQTLAMNIGTLSMVHGSPTVNVVISFLFRPLNPRNAKELPSASHLSVSAESLLFSCSACSPFHSSHLLSSRMEGRSEADQKNLYVRNSPHQNVPSKCSCCDSVSLVLCGVILFTLRP